MTAPTPLDKLLIALRASIARDAAAAPVSCARAAELKALEWADVEEQLRACATDAERESVTRRWLRELVR